jgi:hypothetical protein
MNKQIGDFQMGDLVSDVSNRAADSVMKKLREPANINFFQAQARVMGNQFFQDNKWQMMGGLSALSVVYFVSSLVAIKLIVK